MISPRSLALAGVVAAFALGEGLACASAQAAPSCELAAGESGAFAFGCTGSSAYYATLTLQVGQKTVSLSTGGFQGWVSDSLFSINIGGPTGANTNYMVGVYNGASYNNYFGFDLSSLASNAAVTSATLTVRSGLINQTVEFSLFGATEWIPELQTGSAVNATLFYELAKGPIYDDPILSPNTAGPMAEVAFALNGSAVADINAAIRSQAHLFAISGHADLADAVPEPSTWILVLAGFAGLGFAARRRIAGRRGAA